MSAADISAMALRHALAYNSHTRPRLITSSLPETWPNHVDIVNFSRNKERVRCQ